VCDILSTAKAMVEEGWQRRRLPDQEMIQKKPAAFCN
jgi:hypothetical protein